MPSEIIMLQIDCYQQSYKTDWKDIQSKVMQFPEYKNQSMLSQSRQVLLSQSTSMLEMKQSWTSSLISRRVMIRSLESFFLLLIKYLQQKQQHYKVHGLSIDTCNLYQQINMTISYQQSSQQVVHQLLNKNTQFTQNNRTIEQSDSLQAICLQIFFDDNQHTLFQICLQHEDIQIVGQIILENAISIKKVSERLFLISKLKTQIIKTGLKKKYFFIPSLRYIRSNELYLHISLNEQKQLKSDSNYLRELYDIYDKQIQSHYLQVRYYNIVEYYLQVKFKSIDMMVEYLKNSYVNYKQIISFQSSNNALVIDFDIHSFYNLHKALNNRLINMEQKLRIVSEIKYQQSKMQSNTFEYNTEDKYMKLGNIFKCNDVLALQPYCQYLKQQLLQIYHNKQLCRSQKMKYYPLLREIKNKIEMFKIKRQNNEGQKQMNTNAERAKYQIDSRDSRDSRDAKDKYFNIFQYLYPNLTFLIQALLPNTSVAQNGESSECQIDKVLILFVKGLLSLQSKKASAIYLKVSNNSSQFSIDWMKTILQSSKKWTDVFNCLTLNINRLANSSGEYIGFQQPEYQIYPDTNCLGCTKFFYSNHGNIINSKNTVEIKLFPFVEKISEYENQIIEIICKFLNTNGGIILFNCTKSYTKILANGCLLTEKDKEAIQNKLYSFLNKISPKPQAIKNINLSFVPVATYLKQKSPSMALENYEGQAQFKSLQKHFAPKYLYGVYVARIKVVPKNRSLVYIFQNGIKWFLPGMKRILKNKNKNDEEQYEIKHLNRAIKRNFKRYLNQSKIIYLSKSEINPLQHECCPPWGGIKIQGKSIQGNKMQIKKDSHPEQDFANVSLIVCKSKYLPRLKQKLIRIGIRCEIKTYFTDQQHVKLKAANNTAVLFHDCRFDDLIFQLRSTSELQFQGRIIIAIYVTKYLKFQSNIQIQSNNQLLIAAYSWLQYLFPGQQMKFYRYKPEQKRDEYYLQTNTKLSTLFMYLVFNSYEVKSSLRNPLHLDKQTPLQKSQKFKIMDVQFCINRQGKEAVMTEDEKI